ncbi:DMT family transporter [Salsuginibacillus kocurii]|uniref:DMT family transporter n=1 Tax=Salsuginibacillus kocurii TaxID=427078 RepID=UPI00036A816B|nr:DMT family transporter [Salsuginibacillus kocurii]
MKGRPSPWMIAILVLFLTFTWGLSYPVMKIGIEDLDPFSFSFFRFLVGSVCLFLMVRLWQGSWVPERIPFGRLLVLGILQTLSVFGLMALGIQFIDSSITSILIYTMPVWTVILAVLFLNEPFTKRLAGGLTFVLLGLGFMIVPDMVASFEMAALLGVTLVTLAAVIWAVANIFYRMKLNMYNSMFVSAMQMGIGTVGLGGAAFLFEAPLNTTWTLEAAGTVVFTGFVASSLCFAIWYYLLQVVRTSTTVVSSLLVPVFGVSLGALILGEAITMYLLAGMACVLLGIAVVQLPRSAWKRMLRRT